MQDAPWLVKQHKVRPCTHLCVRGVRDITEGPTLASVSRGRPERSKNLTASPPVSLPSASGKSRTACQAFAFTALVGTLGYHTQVPPCRRPRGTCQILELGVVQRAGQQYMKA